MGKQMRCAPAEFRAKRAENGEKRIEGYFSTFDGRYEMPWGDYETVAPGAFDGALDDDIRALIDHESRLVLGRTTAKTLELRVDAHGLWGSILLNENDQDAMNLYARVERGDVSQCSFGFEILEESYEVLPDQTVHWTIQRVRLFEVSVVTFPAYENTSVAARKQMSDAIRERALDRWKITMRERLANGTQTTGDH